jgi:(2R)-3-sulfolactate dehydrogenase (NADP+)
MRLSLDDVSSLSLDALVGSGATLPNAEPVADSMREAEAEGLRNVGLGYLPTYCRHLRNGKVDGQALPTWKQTAPAAILADAAHGFAHPAFVMAHEAFVAATATNGIAMLGIERSYSAGVVGWFVERLAARGLVSLAFANTSPLMAAWGGKRPFFGTNPLGFGVPRRNQPPIVIDMAVSATARVNVLAAAATGGPIPPGWAIDVDGEPTTDPVAAVAGTVAPSGGYKGYALALMVEVLAAGLTGASWGFEASDFLNDAGGPPNVGQLFIALSPERLGGQAFTSRIEDLVSSLSEEEGVRLPGDHRHAARERAGRDGVEVPEDLLTELRSYC